MGQTNNYDSDSSSEEENETTVEIRKRDIKVVYLGNDGVGKTCAAIRQCHNKFSGKYLPTIFDNKVIKVIYCDRMVGINLWDTACHEDYDTLRPLSYQNTDVFVLFFDVMNRASFNNVKKWHKEATEYSDTSKFVLCGTKTDLLCVKKEIKEMEKKGEKPVDKSEAEQLKEELKCFAYIGISSKLPINTDELLTLCLNSLFKPNKKRSVKRRKEKRRAVK